jgi:hypothetical protein
LTINRPVGFAALLEKMPRRFAARAKRVEERARLRREAQAKRFEMEFLCAIEVKEGGWNEWQDTVAEFAARKGDDHGIA